jgi:hypothetical protein
MINPMRAPSAADRRFDCRARERDNTRLLYQPNRRIAITTSGG